MFRGITDEFLRRFTSFFLIFFLAQVVPSRDFADGVQGQGSVALDCGELGCTSLSSSLPPHLPPQLNFFFALPLEIVLTIDGYAQGNYLVGEMTPYLQETIGWRLYPMHAGFCVLSFLLVFFTYPESALLASLPLLLRGCVADAESFVLEAMGVPLEEMGSSKFPRSSLLTVD